MSNVYNDAIIMGKNRKKREPVSSDRIVSKNSSSMFNPFP
jgi:hypothetical protein